MTIGFRISSTPFGPACRQRQGRGDDPVILFSTGWGSTSLTHHTRGSATADAVLRSLTPYQGSEI
jgi:hypothetical protein